MKPLLTLFVPFCLFHAFLASGPAINTSLALPDQNNASSHRQQRRDDALEYIFLAYDIVDVFAEEDVMNLEHDDNNRCMFVKSEGGIYSYTSPPTADLTDVCSLYIVTDASQLVEFQFMEFSVSCSDGGLVSLIDGWELNGQFFPSEEDHALPRDQRYMEFCGTSPPVKKYVTGQNVGLIEFRIPISGQGFRVLVQFRENPMPCNALIQLPHGSYNIQNFGRRINCSVSILFPSSLTMTNVNVGAEDMTSDEPKWSSGETLHRQCHDRGLSDYVEIRGGHELDPMFMATFNDYCGIFPDVSEGSNVNATQRALRVDVGCGNTVMRLVSSGVHVNSVSFQMELFFDTQTCPRSKITSSG